MKCRMLLFDLDGTLLRSDKTISERALSALGKCSERSLFIGISTSRSEVNAEKFTRQIRPDILISSGGALINFKGKYIYKSEFSKEETRRIIDVIRSVCGRECEITADTPDAHFWNYKTDPKAQDKSWGDSIYTDFDDFKQCTLKICGEIFEESHAKEIMERLDFCDCIRFTDGYWYKFTKKGITKERGVSEACAAAKISPEEVTAFGDDLADIPMLRACGLGIAMGNAAEEVKQAADIVIGGNDEEAIAKYLEENFPDIFG